MRRHLIYVLNPCELDLVITRDLIRPTVRMSVKEAHPPSDLPQGTVKRGEGDKTGKGKAF
jgi:hypothetical protein